MIYALVLVVVFGLALYGGYKWGSHEATESAVEEFNKYENTQGPYNITPVSRAPNQVLETE